jgi:hypothetical protein
MTIVLSMQDEDMASKKPSPKPLLILIVSLLRGKKIQKRFKEKKSM